MSPRAQDECPPGCKMNAPRVQDECPPGCHPKGEARNLESGPRAAGGQGRAIAAGKCIEKVAIPGKRPETRNLGPGPQEASDEPLHWKVY